MLDDDAWRTERDRIEAQRTYHESYHRENGAAETDGRTTRPFDPPTTDIGPAPDPTLDIDASQTVSAGCELEDPNLPDEPAPFSCMRCIVEWMTR